MTRARYILEKLKKNNNLNEPLVIYEVGPGSGCLASSILGFFRSEYPGIYKTMTYNLIEISPRLKNLQKARLHEFSDKIVTHSTSILEWDKLENRNCFIIALEVLVFVSPSTILTSVLIYCV